MVFPFLPIPYHRVCARCCFFGPRIGHLGFADRPVINDVQIAAPCERSTAEIFFECLMKLY
jgi:hypothetical protein